jgi:hypothetical protein
MKHFLILFGVMFLIIAVGVFAQTADTSSPADNTVTSEAISKSEEKTQPSSPQPTVTPTASPEIPRKYPIAAGVWYPGDPLPKVPSRYYRVRCWPGCHHYGKYANPPKSEKKTPGSH